MATKRETIKMQSTVSDHFYSTRKNKSNTQKRLSLKKYDPKLRKHVEYQEKK